MIKGLSFSALRVGKKYRLINHGELFEFELENILSHGDFRVKDLHTLERYHLNEIIQYGKGNDFEIRELE